jgi:hypothetical protein
MRAHTIAANVASCLLISGVVLAIGGCGGGNSGSPTESASAPTANVGAPTTSNGSDTPAAAGEIDACALVTKDEVEAALGKMVLDPKSQQFPSLATCDFNDPATSYIKLVSVTVHTEPGASDARTLFEQFTANGSDQQAVTGVGDDASWDSGLTTLEILQDKYEITVAMAPAEGTDQLTAAKTIAAKVVAGLK